MKKAYLVLQNGQTYEGTRFGASGDVMAELAVTTSTVGYLETLTDPSLHGQMLVQTFPLIGNYGVIPADFESERPRLSAYIVREACDVPSNFRCEGKLDDYLRDSGVIGLCDVDTRALARALREHGAMNAAIVDELPVDKAAFTRQLKELDPSSDVYQVTCSAPYALGEGDRHVVLWDLGLKKALIRMLTERGCRVTVVPASASAESILALGADGLVLSGGPGDPAKYPEIIEQVRRVAQAGVPTFGVCLGHLMLGLAMGAKRVKMKRGHHGANQPVRRIADGRLFITSQGHGYAIDRQSLPQGARLSYENVNDSSCEGIEYEDARAFSVQFGPEACAGPKDTGFLFDQFVRMMEVR